jgi:hypothetical protein
MRAMKRIGVTALLILGSVLPAGPARADSVAARWIQLGPGNQGAAPTSLTPTIWARAVTTDGSCPALAIDGAPAATPMGVRFSNTPGFPVTECEAVVPAGHATATVGGVDLKLPVENPKRILVIADTGCRMNGTAQQNCNDPSAFPLQFLANYEALFKPDLVVHVGDYFYRDTDCQGAFPGCNDPSSPGYEPWGDNWGSWNADLLTPAATLLAAAPWVMTRGNHESCGRGAHGWYSLLDPRPYDANAVNCTAGSFTQGSATSFPTGAAPYGHDFEPSYLVPAGPVTLIVHDSSYANDSKVDAVTAARYAADLASVLAAVGTNATAIFTTHKPAYGLVTGMPTSGGDATEQYLFNGLLNGGAGVPYSVGLFLSGHIHQFEYLNFSDYTRYAPQLIVGVGGTLLDTPTAPPALTDAYQDQAFTLHDGTSSTTSAEVTHAYSQAEFGFAVLHATPAGYLADVYSIGASRRGRCRITLGPNLAPGTQRGISCWQ